ncbi:MAG: DUF4040 domain-containing protein [Actinophytocola sp.]|nr:DUF4040 domain-containing protein [Actinophytocola sp.]
MLIAIVGHFLLAALLPVLVPRYGRAVFAVGALVPAATLAVALSAAPRALSEAPPVETVSWAPELGLEVALRFDALGLAMTVLVSGIGAVALLYYACYAAYERAGIGRNAVLLVVFAGAMLGLVLADDIFGLYVFWELTTLCSFLLIGGDGVGAAERRSALQALLVTTVGSLAMLLGLITLGSAAGSFRISEIVAAGPAGPLTGVALVLVLIGALTKSAQLPFHPWLPAAMVAPTPISAYLHAAAMVKAGVYLVARLAPGFGDVGVFQVMVLGFGLATMLVGGMRALFAQDLKKLLAHGTVSQLGFLFVLFGAGTRTAAIAGMVMLLAHGLFKAPLFFTVGVLDKLAGSREMTELSGAGRRWPALAVVTALPAASMAGLPPLLGFAGKETSFEAFLSGGVTATAVLIGLVTGSALTVAYTARFLWGAFAAKPGVAPVRPPRHAGFLLVIAVLALAGLLLGPLVSALSPLITGYADALPGDPSYEPALWHGFGVPVLLSAGVLAAGYVLHRVMPRRPGGSLLPGWLDAQRGYERAVHGTDVLARRVTGGTQSGSLPVYLGVILLVFAVVPGVTLLAYGGVPDAFRGWDNWLQVPLTVLVVLAAIGVLAAKRRLTAVLLAGAIGYAIGALFVVHGAPDLALAQFLVETLTLIVFVFVLRRFPATFQQRGGHGFRNLKAAVAIGAGCFVAFCALLFSSLRTADPVASQQYATRAKADAGASNVVNAILVDFRAFDTLGEIAVLAVAVTGAATLILISQRTVHHFEASDEPDRERPAWQHALVLDVFARALFPTMLLFSVYLLFAGHDHLGGGFPAGLVAGLGFVLRYLVGGSTELSSVVRVPPLALVGAGLGIVAVIAVAPVAFGYPVFTSATASLSVPLLGELELASNLAVDVGVYVLIVGGVLDLLRTLGASLRPSEADIVVEAGERR